MDEHSIEANRWHFLFTVSALRLLQGLTLMAGWRTKPAPSIPKRSLPASRGLAEKWPLKRELVVQTSVWFRRPVSQYAVGCRATLARPPATTVGTAGTGTRRRRWTTASPVTEHRGRVTGSPITTTIQRRQRRRRRRLGQARHPVHTAGTSLTNELGHHRSTSP